LEFWTNKPYHNPARTEPKVALAMILGMAALREPIVMASHTSR
jgi:hypothetical protein